MIGQLELEAAVAAGQDILGRLRADYPRLKAYLVLSHHREQVELTTDPEEILAHCNGMVADSAAKQQALVILDEVKRLESLDADRRAIQSAKRPLEELLKLLRYDPAAQVELRFADLRYALVWALQVHSLVDRTLTPQTKAAIRIVLGNLDTLGHAGPLRATAPPARAQPPTT